MKCPVCKNEVKDMLNECDVCGFCELKKTFINIEDAKLWEEKVVFPLRAIWISSQNMHKLVVSKYMCHYCLCNARHIETLFPFFGNFWAIFGIFSSKIALFSSLSINF